MPSDTNITVTGRHIEVTDAIRDFATKKIEAIHIDYPKIVEARVVVDVQKDRQMAEIVLFLAKALGVTKSSIEVVHGTSGRIKLVEIPDGTDLSVLEN